MGALSFNEMEIDALGEMMNISLGASATAMSTLLGSTVHITTPKVKILTRDQFEFKKLEPAVGVEIAYVEGLEGSNIMMFSRNDVRIIVGTLLGEEVPDDKFELDEINRSAICEVMNQMMGASATALSEFLKFTVNISTPVSFEITDAESFKNKYFPEAIPMVVISFTLDQLIALGGAIGTGLFYGSSESIALAGPSILLAYLVGGFAIFMIVRALSEMSVEDPKAGAFSYYATRYWSKRAGFISGWNYWFNYILVSMVELSVVGKFVNYWFPAIPTWVSAAVKSATSSANTAA